MGPRRVKNKGPGDTGGVNGAAYVLCPSDGQNNPCIDLLFFGAAWVHWRLPWHRSRKYLGISF